MDPIFLSIGDFTIRWYGFMAALGFLSGVGVMQLNRKLANLTSDQVTNVMMMAMISGVLGSRIFYVAQNWNYYQNHLGEIIRIDQGGLVFYGGFILAALSLWIYTAKICKADTVRVLDILAPAVALGHAFGRVGCFLNGCCYGKPAEVFWAIGYPAGTEPFKRYGSTPLHPVQLYETVLNLLLAGALFYLVRKTPKRGVTFSAYILAYGILRFVDEFFRGDHSDFVQGFTPAQVIGFGTIPLGLALVIYFLTRKNRAAAETESK